LPSAQTIHRAVPPLLAIVVVGAGALYSLWLGPELRYTDEVHYLELAEALAANGRYAVDGTPTAYRPPGYPFLLAVQHALGIGVVGMRIANFLLLGLVILATGRLLALAASPLAGTLGAGVVAGFPVFFYTAGTLYPQTLGLALLAVALLVVVSALRRRELASWPASLAGAALGWAVLAIPAFLFTLGVTVAWIAVRSGLPQRYRKAVLVAAVAACVVLPWTLRNYLALDAFVPVSTNSGVNLLLGNSLETRPNSGVNVDISAAETAVRGMTEVERDDYFRYEALRFLREDPSRGLLLYVRKWLNHFNYRNELATEREASGTRDLILLVSYGPLLALFLARLLATWRWPLTKVEELLAVVYLAMPFFLALYFTRIRFRVPFDLCLIAGVSLWVAAVLAARWPRLEGLGPDPRPDDLGECSAAYAHPRVDDP